MRESYPEYFGPVDRKDLDITSDENLDLAAENLKDALDFGGKKLNEKKDDDEEVRS